MTMAEDFDIKVAVATLLAVAVSLGVLQRLLSTIAAELSLRQAISSAQDKDKHVSGVVSALYTHPVKSLRAVSLESAALDAKGIQNDRRFMVVYPIPLPIYKTSFDPSDSTHRFFTQRQCPALATIKATIHSEQLTLDCGKAKITVSVTPPSNAKQLQAGIWGSQVTVEDMGDEVAAFLQSIVNGDHSCSEGDEGTEGPADPSMYRGIRLVAHTANDRTTTAQFTPAMAKGWMTNKCPQVSLTDGFPILIACQASLDEVNRRLKKAGKESIPMSRFRPNIVIEGTEPFEEDRWKTVAIGDQLFSVVKACPRCKQSCTDQTTGKVSTEPLETMKEFRALGDNKEDVFFAQNAIPIGNRTKLHVKDSVKVITRGDPVYC